MHSRSSGILTARLLGLGMNRLTALSSRVAILLFGTVVAAVSIAIIAITTVGYASVHSGLYESTDEDAISY